MEENEKKQTSDSFDAYSGAQDQSEPQQNILEQNIPQQNVSEQSVAPQQDTTYHTRWTSDDSRQDYYKTSEPVNQGETTPKTNIYAGQQAGAQQTNTYAGQQAGAQQTNTYVGQQVGAQQTNTYAGQNVWASQQSNSWNQQYQNGQFTGQAQNSQWQTNQGQPEMNQNGGQPPRKHKKITFRKNSFGMKLVKCAAFAAVFGLVAGGVFQGVNYATEKVNGINSSQKIEKTETEAETTLTSTESEENAVSKDVSKVVDNVMPSIVSITTLSQTEVQDWFGQAQTYETEGAGSGIIVSQDDENLYVATNNHVVTGATSLTVCFNDETTATGEIKGTDPGSDLAVVAVAKKDLSEDTLEAIRVATLGNSDSLVVGESAIAIGNALGYGQSVTTGVISALNREVSVQDETTGATVTNELIQTDAAINPGNSGGALINTKGEVVGINSVKYSDTAVEGIGYAIPMESAKPIIEDLITRELVDSKKSAYLGISGVDVTDSVSATYGMPEGIYVADVVKGSAAEQAGIVTGVVITQFDGHKVTAMADLQDLLQYYEAGTDVEVIAEVSNNGTYEEKTFTVTLGSKN